MEKKIPLFVLLALALLIVALIEPGLYSQEADKQAPAEAGPELIDQGRSKFKTLMAVEGLSLKAYKNIVPVMSGLQYEDVRSGIYPGQTEYELSPEEKEQLERSFGALYVRELLNWERFPLVEKPEPDSLYLKLWMSQIISYVPPPSVRQQHTFKKVFSGTLHIEVYDCGTGHLLMRIEDPFLIRESRGIRYNEFLWSVDSTQRKFKSWGANTKALLQKYDK